MGKNKNNRKGSNEINTLLPPVFDAYYDDNEEEEEIVGYECMSCGNIQGKCNGFGCDRCSAPLTEWYG